MSSKVQRKDRKYKDLSMKQKTRIADKTYHAYQTYYLEQGQMPDKEEQGKIHKRLFQLVLSLAPNATFEDFEILCEKRSFRYEERIKQDIDRGVTLESLYKPKKTSVEKAAIQKAKNEARRKKKKLLATQSAIPDQDDKFFFIAGYTSGGAPYGVSWEQMEMDSGEGD